MTKLERDCFNGGYGGGGLGGCSKCLNSLYLVFFFSHFSFHAQTHSESSVCVCVFQLFAPRSHMLGIFRKRKWALLAFSVSRNHFICAHFDFGIIMFL